MRNPPCVSIVMSAYNGAGFLRLSMESILAQTFQDFEFIVVDDASTDGSSEMLREFARRDPRVLPIRLRANEGCTRALNHGLARARGEYIARMDADDASLPERIARQVTFLDTHADIGVLGCAAQLVDAEGRCGTIVRYPSESGLLRWFLFFCNPLIHPTVVMRRAVLKKSGPYDPKMFCSQDYELYSRLCPITQFSNLPEPLLHLRKHDRNISVLHQEEQRRCWLRVATFLMESALGHPVDKDLVAKVLLEQCDEPATKKAGAELVSELHDAFRSQVTLSASEREWVQRDVDARLRALYAVAPSHAPGLYPWLRKVLKRVWDSRPLG